MKNHSQFYTDTLDYLLKQLHISDQLIMSLQENTPEQDLEELWLISQTLEVAVKSLVNEPDSRLIAHGTFNVRKQKPVKL